VTTRGLFITTFMCRKQNRRFWECLLKRVRALLGTGGDAEIRTVAGVGLLRIKSPDLRVGVRIRSPTLESVDGWYDVPMIPSTEIRQDGRQTCGMQETHRLDGCVNMSRAWTRQC